MTTATKTHSVVDSVPKQLYINGEWVDGAEGTLEVEDPDIGPFPMQNVVPRLSETPGEIRWTGPKLGQHNDEVYREVLDLSGEELEDLRERGIV